ncbi:DoxX family protein [Salisaeta longa]|uniref:DoxX family protein n=1 Tax=Salisaeta longa TaxID=503170 RepID=UPI0003B53573|nr:DoxX family protein [Salisaeta longa]
MNVLNRIAPHAHWFLRISLASVFLYHGLAKFPVLGALASMMKMPVAMVAVLAIMETLGGALILAGGVVNKDWVTRLGGLLLVPIMLGAIFMVHAQHGWNSVNMGSGNMGRGMEFQVTLLLQALTFLVVGNAFNGLQIGTGAHKPQAAAQ